MKRIRTIGVVVTFVSAATTALAGCCTSSYPSGVQQDIPLSQDRHRNHSACTVYTPDWPYSVPGG
ncbi:MAG: hypothetical protein JWN13_6013 [Betaproteobacteria bacterium]|jgi:hypothetical protein|nr:hypothetical protein [Betaproteobacteria bacterium]